MNYSPHAERAAQGRRIFLRRPLQQQG